ncbi:hypothetical protein PFLUV_G00104880 [Perca fluviatilis]|uniref:Uncharacterized protein n=1 Tax=Perca fluviatilis TaxID=8168 RepID=A0A6A5FA50_PERFL|nr:hypothetical protein PFLUV_G00104880 [Perca fluviatilis]
MTSQHGCCEKCPCGLSFLSLVLLVIKLSECYLCIICSSFSNATDTDMEIITIQKDVQDDVMRTGSCLSLAVWDDETPGPSYTTAGGRGDEDECLIVGYKKPTAERTPELVQLSSDSVEEEKMKEKLPPLAFLPTIPPCTSCACSSSCREEPDDGTRRPSDTASCRERKLNDTCMKSESCADSIIPNREQPCLNTGPELRHTASEKARLCEAGAVQIRNVC